MATNLVTVTVTKVEADNGFLIRCSGCPHVRTIYPTRPAADAYATKHRAKHQRPADEEWL